MQIIHVYGIAVNQLQTQMQEFEQLHLDNQYSNIFQSVQEIINQEDSTYYSPPLLIFNDYTEHISEYSLRFFTASHAIVNIIKQLDLILLNGNDSEKTWATERKNALQSETPDLNNVFIFKQKQFFQHYQNIIDQIEKASQVINVNSTKEEINASISDILGANTTSFILGKKSQLLDIVPFSNPTLLQNIPKDIILTFKQFNKKNIILQTLYETATLYDRVWLYAIDGNIINLIQALFFKQYLSIIQIQNNIEIIEDYLLNYQFREITVKLDFVQTLCSIVETLNKNLSYIITEQTNQLTTHSLISFFIFSSDQRFAVNRKLKKLQNINVYLVSEKTENQFNVQFLDFFDLILGYNSFEEYKSIQLQAIIKHQQQCNYINDTFIGTLNNSLIFMKPVYINDEYFGSIYKLFEFENLFFYNNVNYFDQVSRDIILDQKTNRVLFDPFAQRSAPYSIINGQIKYLPQLKPIVFNHSELLFDFSKSVRTTNIQNYDYIDDDIFIRKESVLYQLKSVVDQYAGIISISNRALTMKLRSAFKSCDQSAQSLQDLKEYYRQYQSKLKYNITEQRAISSPSHTNINDECSFKLNIQCVDDSSQYYAARKIVKTVFGIPSQQCQFNQSSYFSFHFGMENILDEIESQTSENQSVITGNLISMTQLLRQSYLLAGQGKNGQLQYGLIKYLNVPQSTTVKFLSQYLLKRDQSNYQDIQYDETIDQNTPVVIPMMIYDILYSLNDIALFSQATYNLEKLVSDPNVLEIQIGHVFNDQKDITLKNLYTNYYSIYTSQNNVSTTAQARFKLFSNILSYFQLHYFTYSSGPNWKAIMKEQLKIQPLGQIQKYRIGQINGNVAITKALLVTNKNLDNQTGVNGFLTLVLNTPFNLQIKGQHTYLDSCTRYISGIENKIYLEGVRHVLSNFKYLQRTRINYTINDYNIIYEINTSFWHDALNRAENNEFIIAVTQGKSVFENYLNQANYDESQMHERTIIFDAKSLYFVSGKLIVKQYGAIDGLIIIYDDIVLNSETNINNSINELNQKQQMDTVDVDKLDYFYYNLTSRVTKTVQSIIRRFPANYVKNKQIQYAVNEEILILFCFSFPLIVIVLIICSKQNRIQYSYKIDEQTCENLSNLILSSSSSIISRLHSVSLTALLPDCTPTDFNWINTTKYIHKSDKLLVKVSKQRNCIFHQDMNYDAIAFKQALQRVKQPYILFFNLSMSQQTESHFEASFLLLTTAQQYSLILNNLRNQPGFLTKNRIKLSEFRTVVFSVQAKYFKVPRVRLYAQSQSDSIIVSKINSVIGSRADSRVLSFFQSQEETEMYQRYFDDSVEFYDRGIHTPCQIQIMKITTFNVKDLLKEDLICCAINFLQ
ncbi:Conserved_hypothetical protein [Hexamita inflata]|uniref:Transmembrane protein n=1 Tax=Hexamita inflata TaxID=28002 RepID=A0AA86QGS4_9EUKA|nr:Conserved hypothetical protein [Hexamita inflata]